MFLKMFIERLSKSHYADRLSGIIRYWPEAALSFISFISFLLLKIKKKTVLLVEPNTFHGVVLPGFYKYFHDLGYNVLLISRYANVKDSSFCRVKDKPKIFVFDPLVMRWVLRSKKIQIFDFVLFTSRQIFAQDIRVWGDYFGYLKSSLSPRFGIFYIEHHLLPRKILYPINTRELFGLTRKTLNGTEVPILNPHYFGEVNYTKLSKGKRVFIFVGEVSPKKGSIHALLDVVRKLEKTFEFEVWLVGKGADSSLSDSLPASVKTFGRLPFNEMFGLLEEADFSLPLLDPRNDAHKDYLHGVTSGMQLLILGFLKVPVIHADFAKAYDFSAEDSILHEDEGFIAAMERALTMTENEYNCLQKGLKKLTETFYHESLENLKQRIDERISASSL